MATLTVAFTNDFSAIPLSGINHITFTNIIPATATFAATQFDGAAIRDNLLLTGSAGINQIRVNGSGIDASAWRFIDWDRLADFIILDGTAHDDAMIGSRKADAMTGREGDDLLVGLAGDDTIKGGTGRDIIFGGLGADTLIGGRQRDEFHYTSVDELAAGESINGGQGTTDRIVLDGAALEYDFLVATIANTEELQFIQGGVATFDGSQIGGTSVLQTVTGSAERDQLIIEGRSVDLSNLALIDWGQAGFVSDQIVIKGTGGTDSLIGSSGGDIVWATAGGDIVSTGRGRDDILMGSGAGSIDAGEDDDQISIAHAISVEDGDVIDGGDGHDTLRILQAYTDEVPDFTGATIRGLEHLSFIDDLRYHTGITARFTGGQIDQGAITEVDVFADHTTIALDGQIIDLSHVTFTTNDTGSDAKVVLTGTTGADTLYGSTLADIITGGAALDMMSGAQGRDTFVYNGEDDLVAGEYIDGGNQRDTLELHGASSDIYHFAEAELSSIEVLTLAVENLTAQFRMEQLDSLVEINDLSGSQFIVISGADIDLHAVQFPIWDSASSSLLLSGSIDADTIVGSTQADFISGDQGDDVLDGGAGDDIVSGEFGRDEMTGGAGRDSFFYVSLGETPTGIGRDRINDFTQGEDTIDLSNLYFYNFTFLADATFSGNGSAEFNYVYSGNNTIVQLDGDGDGAAESKIALTGLVALTADDFIL